MTLTDTPIDPRGAALLRAICLHPADLSRREVYADWLEEHGQEMRADFIRVQIAITKRMQGPVGPVPEDSPYLLADPNYYAFRRRERELLYGVCGLDVEALPIVKGLTRGNYVGSGHYGWFPRDWFLRDNHAPERDIQAEFRNGFPEIITCQCAEWLQHGPQIVAMTPVVEVRLSEAMHMQYGSTLQQAMLADGIPVQLPQNEAALVWARRKAGLDVQCWQCEGYGTLLGSAGDKGNPQCDVCNGTGWRPAD